MNSKPVVDQLYSIQLQGNKRKVISLDLCRIKNCLEYLGNPQDKFKSVLIGGTNGKGSVTYYLSNLACKYSDLKVGRYISPHLVSWNERFVINEKIVDSFLLENIKKEVIEQILDFEKNNNETLTEFELYTTIAFYLFAKEGVDIAFLEVGMGGRLDATNVVSAKNTLCSIITNISLDHIEYLGDTVEKIAFEKAGIIKENGFVVSGAREQALEVIRSKSSELKSKLVVVDTEENNFYQNKNIKIVKASWKVICDSELKQSIRKVSEVEKNNFLKSLQFSGRFQYINEHKILLDGAHNPQAGKELRKLIDKDFSSKKIIYILGMLDKDHESFIKNLLPYNSTVICTEPKSIRATGKEVLARCVVDNGSNANISSDLQSAIQFAKSMEHDIIIITGSLYLVGEALQCLKNQVSFP